MKTASTLLVVLIIFPLIHAQTSSNSYFPLEVGNRWDYFVMLDPPGGPPYYDTLSIEILSREELPNGKSYFVFSEAIPFSPLTKYVRMDDGFVYFYKIEDSTDCFAFRFDLPHQTNYYNCVGYDLFVLHHGMISLGPYLAIIDSVQEHWPYRFSKKLGVIEYFKGGIIEITYELRGCKISGEIFGNLLVSVDNGNNLINQFNLNQNYPNPVNPTTKIKYSIPKTSKVKLTVFDVLGVGIETLVNEEEPVGIYEVSWNANGLPSGIYFYQLRAGEFVDTKKMMLLR